jgi:hypothetical protein
MCTVCGLPRELCICEEVAKEQQRIAVKVQSVGTAKKLPSSRASIPTRSISRSYVPI